MSSSTAVGILIVLGIVLLWVVLFFVLEGSK